MTELIRSEESTKASQEFIREVFTVDDEGNLQFNLPLKSEDLDTHYPPIFHLLSAWWPLEKPKEYFDCAFAPPEKAQEIEEGMFLFKPSMGLQEFGRRSA